MGQDVKVFGTYLSNFFGDGKSVDKYIVNVTARSRAVFDGVEKLDIRAWVAVWVIDVQPNCEGGVWREH